MQKCGFLLIRICPFKGRIVDFVLIQENKRKIIFSHILRNEWVHLFHSQPAFICSKLTIKTLEQGVKFVQS